ncbi:MAG: peptidase C39 family protein [Patescibacteria group bacterium]
MQLSIPFYSNTKDGLHCFQACLKSILKYYFPSKSYSFGHLDKVTAHKKGKYTWDFAALLFLADLGFEVIYITPFDLKEFSLKGEKFLKSVWTDEVYQDQKKYSDFKQEQKLAKKLIKDKGISIKRRSTRISDIRKLFSRGFLLMVPVNSLVFEGIKGYYPHIVLINGITKYFIYFHDSGNPPHPNCKASIKKFWRAASYPDNSSVDLIAVRYSGNRL